MEKKKQLVIKILFTVVALIVVSGCNANRIDLVRKGTVSVETVSSEKVKLLWASAYQQDKTLLVCGRVGRFGLSNYPLRTHVDISIISPSGEVLYESQTEDIFVPRHTPGKGPNSRHFRLRFPTIPQQGSLVQVVCHSGLHPNATLP